MGPGSAAASTAASKAVREAAYHPSDNALAFRRPDTLLLGDALFGDCRADVVAPSSQRRGMGKHKMQSRRKDVPQAQRVLSPLCDWLRSSAGSDDRKRCHDDPSGDVARSQPSRRAHADASSCW